MGQEPYAPGDETTDARTYRILMGGGREGRLLALVKAAVELAFTRNAPFSDEDGTAFDDREIAEIAEDVQNALRGHGTCEGGPTPEWEAAMRGA